MPNSFHDPIEDCSTDTQSLLPHGPEEDSLAMLAPFSRLPEDSPNASQEESYMYGSSVMSTCDSGSLSVMTMSSSTHSFMSGTGDHGNHKGIDIDFDSNSNPNNSCNLNLNINDNVDTQVHDSSVINRTPLPWKRLVVVFACYMTDMYSFTTLIPYIAFMTSSFQLTEVDCESGEVDSSDSRCAMLYFYAGFIASSYYIGQFISCMFWGWASDKFGRKPIILAGISGSVVTSLLFGFSKTLWMAMGSRFMFGLVNGNLAVFKTYLGEITDSTNQARAFSYIGLTWGIGSVTGALVGGVLARPLQQYGWLESILPSPTVWFLETFPYVLPNMFVSLISLIGACFAFLFLTESNPAILAKREQEMRKERDLMKESLMENNTVNDVEIIEECEVELLEAVPPTASSEEVQEVNGDTMQPGCKISHDLDEVSKENTENTVDLDECFEIKQDNFLCLRIKFPSWWPQSEILRSHIPLISCVCYGLMGMAQVMFDETLPLLAKLERPLHGLEMQPYEIGIMSAMIGAIVFVWQLVFCSWITEKLGPLRTYQYSVIASITAFVMMPQVGVLASYLSKGSLISEAVVWAGLFVSLVVRHSTSSLVFCAVGLMINNAVSSDALGQLNGISQSMVAATRFLGPISASVLFSWSISNGLHFPLDTNLVYIIMSVLHVVMFLVSIILDKRVDVPFIERAAHKKYNKSSSPSC